MHFFKPTRFKILLFALIGFFWLLWIVINIYYDASIFACVVATPIPKLPGQPAPPIQPIPFYEPVVQIMQGTTMYLFLPLISPDTNWNAWCDNRLLVFLITCLIIIVFAYLISCIITFFVPKKQKKRK